MAVVIKIDWEERGEHTHMRFFGGPSRDHLANLGTLVMRHEEFAAFISHMVGEMPPPEAVSYMFETEVLSKDELTPDGHSPFP